MYCSVPLRPQIPLTNGCMQGDDLLARLLKAANANYDKVEAMRQAASGQERPVVRQLLVPIRDMLDVVISRCRETAAGGGS